MKLAAAIKKLLRRAVRKIRFNLWLLEGEECTSKKPLSILFLGGHFEKTYLAELAFSGDYSQNLIGKKFIWNLRRVLRRVSKQKLADILVVTKVDRQLYQYLSDGKDFYIPNWAQGAIVFSEALARMKTSGHLKSDLRRIKKNNFTYEVTRSSSKFDEFYHTMYVPHITKTFGRLAYEMSYELMKEKVHEGQSELMLVTRNGEPLAGQILVHENDGVRCWVIGVKDGNREYVKMGAQAALYFFNIQYLSDCGYKAMHVGTTRPFLRDGVMQFKIKWGMSMRYPSQHGFLLKPLRKSKGAMSFLENNPFVYYTGEKYVGVVISDDSTPADNYRNVCAPFLSSGLLKLKVFSNKGHEKDGTILDDIEFATTDTLF
jgi:hypothetical protein